MGFHDGGGRSTAGRFACAVANTRTGVRPRCDRTGTCRNDNCTGPVVAVSGLLVRRERARAVHASDEYFVRVSFGSYAGAILLHE